MAGGRLEFARSRTFLKSAERELYM
jgi:hypothetical protein